MIDQQGNINKSKKYIKEHKEEHLAKVIARDKANPEKTYKRKRKFYDLNIEKQKNTYKQWTKNNPDKVRINSKKHRNHDVNKKEWESCLKYFNYECAYCGMTLEEHRKKYNEQLHKEHLDDKGSNGLDNCVPACKVCNSEKHTFELGYWYNKSNPKYNVDKYNKLMQWINIDSKQYIVIKKPRKPYTKNRKGEINNENEN
jgi:hypothetical protein